VQTLEEQAAQPIVNPSEMGQPSLDAAVAGIKRKDTAKVCRNSMLEPINLVCAITAAASITARFPPLSTSSPVNFVRRPCGARNSRFSQRNTAVGGKEGATRGKPR
jgi:hypothetical protein